MDKAPSPQARRLVLIFWIFIAVVYFYLARDYIRISMADRELGEYLRYVVNVAATNKRPPKDIRALVLNKAEELNLPIYSEQITILGSGEKLTIALDYTLNIDVPVFREGIYSKHFSHKVAYNQPD